MIYFNVKTQFKAEDDNGKVKKVTELYLIHAESVTDAEAKAVARFGEGISEFKVVSAAETKILDVIE